MFIYGHYVTFFNQINMLLKKNNFILAPLVSDNRVPCDVMLLNVRFLKHVWLAEYLTELVE